MTAVRQILLPTATLRAEGGPGDGAPTGKLRRGGAERKQARPWLSRVAALGEPGFLVPIAGPDAGDGLSLKFPDEARLAAPAFALAAEWAADPRPAVPLILALAGG